VSKNITVYSNATLTIESGVEVRFGGAFSLIISGILHADGTEKTITFTSNKEVPGVGDWKGIRFNGIGQSTLTGCFVAYAEDGIFVDNGNVQVDSCTIGFCQNGINVEDGESTVENSTVNSCSQNGINIEDSQSTIHNCVIAENQGNGICVTGNGQINIQENTILANGNGILLTGNEALGVDISQNVVSASKQNGICVNVNNVDVTITNNIVSSGDNTGIYVSTPMSTHITSNSISYNKIGILYDDGDHQADFNDIYGNAMGMDVSLDATVNAEYNYWGDKSGPYHELLNPSGRGNSVGGNGVNLDFIFFLTKPVGYINTRPTAMLQTDKISVRPNDDLMFFAANSFDDDGRVDKYYFIFGDGENSGWTTLSIVTHQYSFFGTYNARLRVLDDYGAVSDDVIVTIDVRLLAPLQVIVDLNNSTIHEGEQVSITVYVTEGTTPVENASVTMFSVRDGNFTIASGLTNSSGYFVTAFVAPRVTRISDIRIVARASETGYTDGSDYKYLEVLPFLSVQITANPDTIKSEGTTQILIHVDCNGEPVSNASVTVLSSSGSLSSENAMTDLSGLVSLVFTAPQTTTFLSVNITATATKDNYMDGMGQTIVGVDPKTLDVQIAAESETTISEAHVNVTVHVEYDLTLIVGANVTVEADNGNFSVTTGLTDNDGNVTFSFTAPQVNAQSSITIAARATKPKYAEGQSQMEMIINPRTFSVQITVSPVESGEQTDVTVLVTCKEDATHVADATVTMSSREGNFSIITKNTDSTGTCTFVFVAPQTTEQMFVVITANVTKNGYLDGGNQTTITVNPRTTPQPEGGWPITTLLLIIIPIIIVVIVVILVKLKIIAFSPEEEEYQ
jgi:hypothetical protein